MISINMTNKVTEGSAKSRFKEGFASQLFITPTEQGYEIWIEDHFLHKSRLIPLVDFLGRFGEPIVFSTLNLAKITANRICDDSKILVLESLDKVVIN